MPISIKYIIQPLYFGKVRLMGTYGQVLSDYVTGKMTVEMSLGHTLQHIDKLYEAQTVANLSRYDLQGKINTLENRINALQGKIDRLTTLSEKFVPKRTKNSSTKLGGRSLNHQASQHKNLRSSVHLAGFL